MPWKFHPKLKVKGPKVGTKWTLLGSVAVSILPIEKSYSLNIEVFFVIIPFVFLFGVVASWTFRRHNRRNSYTVLGPAGVP